MKASEARKIVKKSKARHDIKRFFPLIKDAANKEISFIFVKSGDIKEEEREVLQNEYGYALNNIYDDDGDYHRSGTLRGYEIRWD